jgi:hypothetical protein
MDGVNTKDVIFNRTIYYRDVDRVRAWLDRMELKVYFTPNDAIELMTSGPKVSGGHFEKRRQTVRNLIALANDGKNNVPDTEMLHASLLGFDSVSSGDWLEAARRFTRLSDPIQHCGKTRV